MGIEVARRHQAVRRLRRALDDVDLDMPSGSADRAARPERRRQVDAAADHRRAGGRRTPARSRSTGIDATRLPPQRRNVGFVFQHYAAFKHLTVFRNVAFGLEIRKRPKDEIRDAGRRSCSSSSTWSSSPTGCPSQLSGGQRQRMALARALAVEPQVLLLDEPFGALDAQVRKELRDWLRRLHDEMHVTTVFVTHDQEEAMEVADGIVVINAGRIEQVGSPDRALRQAGERLRDELPRPGHPAGRPPGAAARHRHLHRAGRRRGAQHGHPAAADRLRGAGPSCEAGGSRLWVQLTRGQAESLRHRHRHDRLAARRGRRVHAGRAGAGGARACPRRASPPRRRPAPGRLSTLLGSAGGVSGRGTPPPATSDRRSAATFASTSSGAVARPGQPARHGRQVLGRRTVTPGAAEAARRSRRCRCPGSGPCRAAWPSGPKWCTSAPYAASL